MSHPELQQVWSELKHHKNGGTLGNNLKLCLAAVTEDPANPEFHAMLGACYYRRHDYQAALGAYQEAIRLAPDKSGVLMDVARVHRKLRQYDNEADAYRQAAALEPSNPAPLLGLGSAYYATLDFGKAIEAWTKAAELEPCNVNAHFGIASAYHHAGGLDAARIHYNDVLRLKPNHAESHYGLGMINETWQRYDDAVKEFTAAYEANPDAPKIRKHFAGLLLRAKMLGAAFLVIMGLPLQHPIPKLNTKMLTH